jgi:hypothetical protein
MSFDVQLFLGDQMTSKKMITAILMLCSVVATAQQALDNETIIKMHSAGIGDDIIVSTINGQSGAYVTDANDLIALKQEGISDRVIGAMIVRNSVAGRPATNLAVGSVPSSPAAPPVTPQTAAPLVQEQTEVAKKPRIFLQSVSSGNNVNARRDQSMEMGKDFERDCSAVRVSINQQMADYTVLLNHIETGFMRDNQIQIADKDGDLIAKTKEGGSIDGGVKKACTLILTDWAKSH